MNSNVNKRIEVSIFVLYFLYGISLFNNNKLNNLRYLGLLFIIFMYSILYKKINGVEKNLTLMFIINILMVYFLGVSVYLSLTIDGYVKLISLFISILVMFYIIPDFINIIGFQRYINCVMNSMILVSLVSFILNPNGITVRSDGTKRLTLFFIHANTAGNIFFIIGVLSIYNFLYNKKKFPYLLIYILSFYLTIKTNSRTAIIALIIFSFILYIRTKKSNFINGILIFIINLLPLVLLINNGKFLNIITLDKLFSGRLSNVENMISILKEKDMLLTGIGAFTNRNFLELGETIIDNGYFNILLQFGLIIFFIVLYFLGYLLVKILFLKKDIKIKSFCIALFSTFIIYGIFENIILSSSNIFTLLVYSSVMYYIQYKDQRIKKGDRYERNYNCNSSI